MKSTDVNRYKTETVCVQAGTRKDTTFNAVAVPIYATSTFAFEAPGKTKGYDYSRTANPTRSALEECLAAHPAVLPQGPANLVQRRRVRSLEARAGHGQGEIGRVVGEGAGCGAVVAGVADLLKQALRRAVDGDDGDEDAFEAKAAKGQGV